jgi:hypothetical protein
MRSFSNFLIALATILLMGTACALAIERDISIGIVPAGSITTVTSIYTSVDTRVISPTLAVWTDGSTTFSTTIPIQTPTPSVVTSITTEYVYNASAP